MPADVYLITGFPASGKYTVAQALAGALADRGEVVRVVDNHYVANPILGLIQADGVTPLPGEVWALVGQVRDAVLSAIEQFAPSGWTVIVTNFVRSAATAEFAPYLSRLQNLAEARNGRLVVVCLRCDPDVQLSRIGNADRAARMKSTDRAWLRELLKEHEPWRGTEVLELDTTSTAPADAAAQILDFAAAVNAAG